MSKDNAETNPKLLEIARIRLANARGRVVKIIGLIVECEGPNAGIGELCAIEQNGKTICHAEVVGFRETRTLIMPLGPLEGIRPGMSIVAKGETLTAPVGQQLLGRILDGMGNPIDGLGEIKCESRRSIYASPPNAMQRMRIKEPMFTGIRAIDGFLTIGRGQRMGIFAGSGVGKSVAMGMIARNCLAKVNVIALIGERGREVREFIEKDLGPEGLKRSVVIVATSDQPALVRLKASLLAMSIAEFFRDLGDDVFFLMDSSTRLAMAQREIGLAVGEPPATKGYTPSVFAFLPKLFERAGNGAQGSITALYTVLVDGDDLEDPIADCVRSILDGHIVLSRALANKNHYPAIDVLASISRCRSDIVKKELKEYSAILLRSLAIYRKNEDLINIGAYAKGADQEIDTAIKRQSAINNFLIQGIEESAQYKDTEASMKEISEIV